MCPDFRAVVATNPGTQRVSIHSSDSELVVKSSANYTFEDDQAVAVEVAICGTLLVEIYAAFASNVKTPPEEEESLLRPRSKSRPKKRQASRLNYGLVGESAAMRALDPQIRTAARCDLPVLVSGESGTGKELVARAIHFQSSRKKKPFVSLSCGTLSETAMELELFGYERGAFTGAVRKKRGLLEAAHTGTIFLDKIGEMSPSCQVKLHRVLQENVFRPVGSHSEISVDVRIIVASHRDLATEMALGRFREDLYYHLAVLTINTPTLRSRPSDIPLLVQYFLDPAEKRLRRFQKHKIDDRAMAPLSTYGWPGNVRQLHHVVQRLRATTFKKAPISVDDIHKALPGATLAATAQVPVIYDKNDSLDQFLDRIMLQLYQQLLAKTGSHTITARILRADRVSLYQRIERARRRLELAQF